MEISSVVIECPNCWKKNRVIPVLEANIYPPRCGRCKHPLIVSIVKCKACGELNRVDYQVKQQPVCGKCKSEISMAYPNPPTPPAKPNWLSLVGLLKYFITNRRFPNFEDYRLALRQYNNDKSSYLCAWNKWWANNHTDQKELLLRERIRLQQERERTEREQEIERQQQEQSREAQRKRENLETAQKWWENYHRRMDLTKLDGFTGRQFEEFLALLFESMDYHVELTSRGADDGVDLILSGEGRLRTAVQAKRWKKPVGNSAVQAVLGGMRVYHCDKGIVVVTSSFTPAAKRIAKADKSITLWDHNELLALCAKYLPAEIPPFSWEEYELLKERDRLRHSNQKSRTPHRRYWAR
ncbi:MAG: restriction endonuclease [Armatimonadota bacterium]